MPGSRQRRCATAAQRMRRCSGGRAAGARPGHPPRPGAPRRSRRSRRPRLFSRPSRQAGRYALIRRPPRGRRSGRPCARLTVHCSCKVRSHGPCVYASVIPALSTAAALRDGVAGGQARDRSLGSRCPSLVMCPFGTVLLQGRGSERVLTRSETDNGTCRSRPRTGFWSRNKRCAGQGKRRPGSSEPHGVMCPMGGGAEPSCERTRRPFLRGSPA